jgi:GNAT superfamily N-acetyltransferase
VAVEADMVARALAITWEHVFQALPTGWARRQGGVVAGVTGVGLAFFNGVWPESADPDPATVSQLLGEVAATGLPHCLQLRPRASASFEDLALGRGMVPEQPVPLMLLEGTGAIARLVDVEGLVVRELTPEEAGSHARAAASGFEVRDEPLLKFITPAVLALPGVRCYLGEVDGEPVTTGMGITIGPFVGIFDIATPPAHRGRGYAAAVTARAVADGLAAGARWSWLQSSPAGHSLYRRLGFRDVELWSFWVSADEGEPHMPSRSP